MYTYQSKASQNSIIIALILHAVLFMIFFWIKFEYREIQESRIAVSFVKYQQERVLKRSLPTREIKPVNVQEQKYNPQPLENLQVNANTTTNFFINNVPTRRVSDIREVRNTLLQEPGIQKLKTSFTQRAITADIKDIQPRQIQTNFKIAGGHELIKETDLRMSKPNFQMDVNAENVLKNFLDSIRKKIESKKRYPESAKLAGIEGRSGIRLVILKSGHLESVDIIESSGNKSLDEAALQSVRDAQPFPPIPDSANQEKIEMSIYLVFKIT